MFEPLFNVYYYKFNNFISIIFYCHQADELTLTVGQAFDIAYRKFLERRGQKDVNAQKQLTDMQEQIKAAEAEKEALKQKIAQLEMGPQELKGQVFTENNVNIMQVSIDEIYYLFIFLILCRAQGT